MNHVRQLKRARMWMRTHIVLTAIAFGVYFSAAFFYDPYFFFSDIRAKTRALADTVTVTAKVLDKPSQPIVTAHVACDAVQGTLSVDMDWPTDENSYAYDIFRDGVPLVTGLKDSSYKDVNVVNGKRYDYHVVAHGPMGPGSVTSGTVSVNTPSECFIASSNPTVRMTTIESASLIDGSGVPVVTDTTPTLSGTTNIPYATIDIVVHSDTAVSLRTVANANGYWQVTLPVELEYGSHMAFVTATDPSDPSRVVTQTIDFDVVEADAPTKASESEERTVSRPDSTPKTIPVADGKSETVPLSEIPFDFSFALGSPENSFFQGSEFVSTVTITHLNEAFQDDPVTIAYSLSGSDGNKVLSWERRVNRLRSGQVIRESIALPSDLKPGPYIPQADAVSRSFHIVRQANITVKELPLIDLGGGSIITYQEAVRSIGWVAFISLFSMSSWSLLWIREYWSFAHAKRRIGEKNLSGKGFVAKRKGVSR